MKKILLASALCCASLLTAGDLDYKYEITPMIGGVYNEGNTDLKRNYLNGGISLGINQEDSFYDQLELGLLKSVEDVKFDNAGGLDTSVTRVFANIIKNYPITTDTSLYALVGLGYEVFDHEYAGNEDSPFGNYGVGIRYKVAEEFHLKFDVRHAIETDHGDNSLLYTLGFAFPFGKIAKAAPVVQRPVIQRIEPAPMVPKDSDGDGVIDAKDDCPDTMSGAVVDKVGCIELVDLKINFDVDSSAIKNSYESKILEFANTMKKNTKLKATIEAHTDSTASHAYNQKLSERRAASAVKALIDLGIDSSRLKSMGYGETKPIATNDTVEGRAENRRVTAVIDK